MTPILDAIYRAVCDLFNFKVLWIVIWPMLLATLLWLVLGIVFWTTVSAWLEYGLDAIGISIWLENVEPRWVATVIQAIAHLLLFVPLVFMTALLLTAIFAMPALIAQVADDTYPLLKRESGGGIMSNLLNALVAVCIFMAIWVLTLPLWLVGVGVLIPFIAAAYLNQRLFRYDAIEEHASRAEMQILYTQHRGSWWGLGLLTGFLQFVPLLNLFAPVITALAFIHFGLARLENLRQQPREIGA